MFSKFIRNLKISAESLENSLNFSTVAILPFLLAGLAAAADYCDPKLCDVGDKQAACLNPTSAWSPSCSADKKVIHMSQDFKKQILDTHNKWRNTVASGKANGLPSASRMATIRWDEELAKLAELNIKKCKLTSPSPFSFLKPF